MNRYLIAAVVNNVAAAISRITVAQDPSIPVFKAWGETEQPWREKVLAAVDMHISHPDKTPEQAHDEWVAQRVADGWTYADARDDAKKEHPMIRPWVELPFERRVQDTVLHALVAELKMIPDAPSPSAAEPLQAAPTVARVPGQHVPVKYIGKRPFYRDGTYQTGMTFTHGETKPVPAEKAALLLRHPDVYVMGEMSAIVVPEEPAAAVTKSVKKDDDDQVTQDARDQINAMADKDSVANYVLATFAQNLDRRRSLEVLKAEAIRLIDQLGIPA